MATAKGGGGASWASASARSGEGGVGEEGRSRGGPDHLKKKKKGLSVVRLGKEDYGNARVYKCAAPWVSSARFGLLGGRCGLCAVGGVLSMWSLVGARRGRR